MPPAADPHFSHESDWSAPQIRNTQTIMKSHPEVLIVGAGLTGLATAHALQRAGKRIALIDAAGRPGGAVLTEVQDGWLTEGGPSSLLIDDPAFDELFRELGLAGEVTPANPTAQRRYLVRDGKLVEVPASPAKGISSPLFSWAAKLRIPWELFVPARRNGADESVASFVRRRLGPEFFNYAIDPMVSGIHAGDPERLSIRHAFPKVHALEAEYGGLIRGALALRRARRKSGATAPKKGLVSFRRGLGQLVGALAERLGDDLHLNQPVTRIRQLGDGEWEVETAGESVWRAHQLVLALPAWAFAKLPLPPTLTGAIGPIAGVAHAPMTVVALGFPRAAVGHPLDGFGCLIPGVEGRGILGTLFSSTLFPERAPEGQVLLTSFVGGRRHPDWAAEDDATVTTRVVNELQSLLGLDAAAQPTFQRIYRWPRAIAQYEVGYDAVLTAAADAEAAFPGLHLAGHWRGGIGAPACIQNGLTLGRRLAAGE